MTGSHDGRPVRPPRREAEEPSPPIPSHFQEAARYAGEADAALKAGHVAEAQTLAAIGQIHATLAAAKAAASRSPSGPAVRGRVPGMSTGRSMGYGER